MTYLLGLILKFWNWKRNINISKQHNTDYKKLQRLLVDNFNVDNIFK